MSSKCCAEQCRPFSGHATPYQISSIAFAIEPSFGRITAAQAKRQVQFALKFYF
jgi:hypothetical protein